MFIRKINESSVMKFENFPCCCYFTYYFSKQFHLADIINCQFLISSRVNRLVHLIQIPFQCPDVILLYIYIFKHISLKTIDESIHKNTFLWKYESILSYKVDDRILKTILCSFSGKKFRIRNIRLLEEGNAYILPQTAGH